MAPLTGAPVAGGTRKRPPLEPRSEPYSRDARRASRNQVRSTKETVKVLVAHNYYQQPGGEDATCEQECQLLQRYGHEVVFYKRTNQELEEYTRWQRLRLSADTIWNERSRGEFRALLER